MNREYFSCPACGSKTEYGPLDIANPGKDPFERAAYLVGVCIECGHTDDDWSKAISEREPLQ